MNKAKLRGKMREQGVTQEVLAKNLGVALSTLNRKLQGDDSGDSFSVAEANQIIKILGLSVDDAVSIFFAE